MSRVLFLPPAEEEMFEAARFYEQQNEGLGRRFLDEVQDVMQSIAVNPEAAPVVAEGIRRRMLHKFPFGLLYALDNHCIVVVAVMHMRRKPGYWKERR